MNRGRVVLSDTVEGEDDCALKRRRKERRGGMRAVMAVELEFPLERHMGPQLRSDRQLVMHKAGKIVLEDLTRARPIVDDLVPQAPQFDERLLVKDDAVNIIDAKASGVERAADRQHRKAGIVLAPAQPLLVDREADLVVVDDSHGAVVVVARNSEDQHVNALAGPRSSPMDGGAGGASA